MSTQKPAHTHLRQLFSTTAKSWEQTRCPSVGKGINNRSILTMEYRFSSKKK